MKNIAYFFFLLIFLLLITACKKSINKEISIEKNIDSEIKNWLSKTGIPSVSIVLFKNNKILKSKAYGYSNLKNKTVASTSTIYNTGSNFKSVTATAIMQLKEKGLIDINKPINYYLKQPIKYFEENLPITAKHLMSHQSGLPSSIGINKIWERKPKRTLKEIVATLKPIYKPEYKYEYSNDGFLLLGILIEDVTGMSYESYVWENILKPLHIETYGFLKPTPEMVEDIALPYHVRYNKAYPTNQVQLDQYPAGDVFLKPLDMAKFLMMHLNNGNFLNTRILSNESVKKMHESYIEIGDGFSYGFGFGIDEIDGKKYSNHQGSLSGYLSAFMIDFETKSGVYIATNVTATHQQETQAQELLTYLFKYVKIGKLTTNLETTVERKITDVSLKTLNLEKYKGNYKIVGTPVYLTIEKIGDKLFLINPVKERFRMEYLNSNKFFITTENEEVEFVVNNETIERLVLFSGDKKIIAIKE